jgi:hypothetical protein
LKLPTIPKNIGIVYLTTLTKLGNMAGAKFFTGSYKIDFLTFSFSTKRKEAFISS